MGTDELPPPLTPPLPVTVVFFVKISARLTSWLVVIGAIRTEKSPAKLPTLPWPT